MSVNATESDDGGPGNGDTTAITVVTIVVVIVVAVLLLVTVGFYKKRMGQKLKHAEKVVPSAEEKEPERNHADDVARNAPPSHDIENITPTSQPGDGRSLLETKRINTFLSTVSSIKPWSLDSSELVSWLKEELESVWPSSDWSAVLGALPLC
jgi:hypothetical protein